MPALCDVNFLVALSHREPAGLQAKLREFTKGFPFSPKLWQDASLAAFAVSAGLGFVTFDQGFDKFAGLRPEILLPSS